MFTKRFLIGFALLTLATSFTAQADSITGKVVRVSDGDTIVVLQNNRQIKIRFYGIDTPERAQPWGMKAKAALSNLVAGRVVRVEQKDMDRYGRVVGRVFVGGLDVNLKLVEDGHAWVYRRYTNDAALIAAEHTARNQKRGLWKLPQAERIPPWEWRKAKRSKRKTKNNHRPADPSALANK